MAERTIWYKVLLGRLSAAAEKERGPGTFMGTLAYSEVVDCLTYFDRAILAPEEAGEIRDRLMELSSRTHGSTSRMFRRAADNLSKEFSLV